MINRIKEWDIKNLKINDRQVISLALILSVMALIMAIPGSSNCASANTCTVASTGTFTGNLGIKSNTAYQLTQQHSLAVDQIANWEAVGGNHTGSVIMKDNSGDMNLNGGLRLGTSATSTNGTIRWNGSEVQVYNSGWSGVGGSPTNDIGQVTADSGSFTAATQQDNINIVGGTGITTLITSDSLTINASASAPTCSFGAYVSSTHSVNSSEGVRFDSEYYDPDSCFTFFGSPGNYYGVTYTGASTLVFEINALVNFDGSAARSGFYYWINNTQAISDLLMDGQSGTQIGNFNQAIICLNQNDTITVRFGNTTGNSVVGGQRYSSFTTDQNLGLQAHATSQTCTNGLFN